MKDEYRAELALFLAVKHFYYSFEETNNNRHSHD
jgi:hypothetical protein